jgi:hypothetical protein
MAYHSVLISFIVNVFKHGWSEVIRAQHADQKFKTVFVIFLCTPIPEKKFVLIKFAFSSF